LGVLRSAVPNSRGNTREAPGARPRGMEPCKLPLRRFACDAVFFDLDGVLVDSTAVVALTWRGWAEKRGFDAERILGSASGARPPRRYA
jgi:hypothetical protein